MSDRMYLIPHDFSAVANAALKHAMVLAKAAKADLLVLHLVDDKAKVKAAQTKIMAYIDSLDLSGTTVKLTPLVTVGSIFEDIGRIAEKYNCSKVIMGTHGASGMQKVFGSNAIKVVRSTNLPFYIVQDSTPAEKIENIVVPIDTSKESIQIISFAADIAYLFGSKVHVIAENQRDQILSRQMKNRIKLVEDKFENLGVNATIHMFESSGSYSSKILKYADDVNADLLAVAYYTESLIPALDTFHQGLLTNKLKIPVLIIQSKAVTSMYF